MLGQHGLDLGQLDAEAADLHLTVDPAEELQVARRPAEAHHVVASGSTAVVWAAPFAGHWHGMSMKLLGRQLGLG